MDYNFDKSLTRALKHEGGYVDHPKDPGGATNMGVTLATFREYVKKNGTKSDLKRITREQVAEVYYRHYWLAVKGDLLPAGLDYAMFDFGVNSGPRRAIEFLQRILGVTADGKIGPITLAAVGKADTANLIAQLCDNRLAWLRTLGAWSTFGRGWTSRVVAVKRDALKDQASAITVKAEPIVVMVPVPEPVPARPGGPLPDPDPQPGERAEPDVSPTPAPTSARQLSISELLVALFLGANRK